MRHAGQHARETARRIRDHYLLAIAAVVVATAAIALIAGFWSTAFVVACGVASVAVKTMERLGVPVVAGWGQGADGEEHVGASLGALNPKWHVLHDLSLGRGNIDHVVIGPGGVFTIETKSHAVVSRLSPAWLRQAYAQAKQLERVVGQPVTPLLVFSRARVIRPGSRHRGVTLLPADMLARHLEDCEQILAAEAAASMHARLVAALPARRSRSRRR